MKKIFVLSVLTLALASSPLALRAESDSGTSGMTVTEYEQVPMTQMTHLLKIIESLQQQLDQLLRLVNSYNNQPRISIDPIEIRPTRPVFSQFSIGDKVVTTNRVHVRVSSGVNYNSAGVAPAGLTATVIDGPRGGKGNDGTGPWWQLKFDRVFDTGWVLGNWLKLADSDGSYNNRPPVVHGVSGPVELRVGERGTWTVRASDSGNQALAYSVVWGDEAYVAGQGASEARTSSIQQTATFTHTYSRAGTYYPKFKVIDSDGQSAEAGLSVQIENRYGCYLEYEGGPTICVDPSPTDN